MKVLFTEIALKDVESIIEYVSNLDPKLAPITLDKINTLIEKIVIFPSLGKVGPIEQTRELIVPGTPFKIVYQKKQNIIIHAILHERREWNS